MHIHCRRLILLTSAALLCAVSAVPVLLRGAVTIAERETAETLLQTALDRARSGYRSRVGAQMKRERGERAIAEYAKETQKIARAKHKIRKRMAALQRYLGRMQQRIGVDPAHVDTVLALLRTQRQGLLSQVRDLGSVTPLGDRPRILELFHVALHGDPLELMMLRTRANVERELTLAIVAMRDAQSEFQRLRSDLTTLQEGYLVAEQALENAQDSVAQSTARMESAQGIMADVNAKVLSLQGELARIDARLRAKAERELITRGLLDPEDRQAVHMAGTEHFLWPAHGRVSAGFMDAAYARHFGVPHHGMDIALAQGSPVFAAAQGVVFIVRDGGERGYTYVLVGHRNGYATLYGHLSAVHVQAGQEIAAGTVIGFSGGAPGTPGSGPLTSGAHLHFEVLQNGINVDPITILPS